MKNEHPALSQLHNEATVVGEVESFSTELITIRGNFTPGDVISLRPGARVFILTEDDAFDVMSSQGGLDL